MRIAHVSDIHIRNLKYHQDYRRVFNDFYDHLDALRVDMVVNTGDTAHTKTSISPEFVQMASEFFVKVAIRAPMVNVLGNHDLNLMNADRQDAITPIVRALDDPRIMLWKGSGLNTIWMGDHWVDFHNFGIADPENWPRGPYNPEHINIGLFHGSIRNCITDSNFRMTHVEYDTDIFEGLDFVMMGDIHKRQWFNDKRAWYAGSMIQQNFGEDPEKGFLLWDIRSKTDWDVTFHELKGNRRFYTLKLAEDLTVPTITLEKDARIRISPPRPLTLVEQKAVEKIVKKRYEPHDVITLGAKAIGGHYATVAETTAQIESLRLPEVQERLIRSYLDPRKLPENVVKRVIDLNKKYQISIDQRDEVARNVHWRVLKLGWSNLYNYGENNILDFSQIKGLTGIFAPNAAGKSGLVDAVTIGMFDANTKEVAKNINLVNDNKDKAVVILEVLSNRDRFTIERVIERIKFGQRRGKDGEWGKMSLDFYRHVDGDTEKLVGELRPETEKNIRRRFGTFDDFMLTSLFAQWDPMDLIMCKETERKRILYRFLDLDIFEEKGKLARDESKKWVDKLAELEEGGYEKAVVDLEARISDTQEKLTNEEGGIRIWTESIKKTNAEIEDLLGRRLPVHDGVDLERSVRALELARRGIQTARQDIDADRRTMSSLTTAMRMLESEFSKHDMVRLGREARRFNELAGELEKLNKAMVSVQAKHDHLSGSAELLDRVPCGDQFPSCQFLVGAHSAKQKLPEFDEKLEAFRHDHRRIVEEMRPIQNSPVDLDHAESLVAGHTKTAAQLESTQLKAQVNELKLKQLENDERRALEDISRHEAARAAIDTNARIDEELRVLRMTKFELEDIVEKRRELVTKLNRQLGADQGVLERVRKELEQLQEVRDTCTAFEHFQAAMGKDGIAMQILIQKLPLINEEINKILGQAAEFGVYIEYEPEEQSIRLYLQYGHYKGRILELGSGAEKFLASLAIRAALLSISNLPKSNMFIIDEGFGKLDPQNIESVGRMFDYLKSVFDHVLVISHSDVMKDLVDNTIDIVTDEEGYAHVEVGS